VVSVTELLEQFKAETVPDAPQQPKWETVNGTGDSVFDKFSNVATWSDILMPLGWTEAKVRTPTLSKRGNVQAAPIQYPRKSRKSRPAQLLSSQPTPGLPCGPDQKLNKAKVYAHLHYGGDLSAASKALVHGDAVGLPTLVIEACKTPRDPLEGLYNGQHGEPRTEPPDDGMPPDDPYQEPPEPDPAVIFAEDVDKEARRLRIRDAAQRKVRREQQRDIGNLDPIPLDRSLAIADEPIDYRIDYLWPSGGRTVLAAQWKIGKTTLTGNVIRAFADCRHYCRVLVRLAVHPCWL
jgi:hypothetical protein